MEARYFRYLFENREDGLIHSGCIYDRVKQRETNYIYMAGVCYRRPLLRLKRGTKEENKDLPRQIDLLVAASYTIPFIKKIIKIVRECVVKTVILPYLAPIQRLVIANEIREKDYMGKECIQFLQDPYLYLKKQNIENIYLLYGNGENLEKRPEEYEEGCHFELADRDILQLVKEMEGYYVPVVHAGYIVENKWMFYFGFYGLELKILSQYTRDYFSKEENLVTMTGNASLDYKSQMLNLVHGYVRKFGVSPLATIVMFHGPLDDSPVDNDSLMVQKEFASERNCSAWIGKQQSENCSCAIRCQHRQDYDTMQRHKDKTDSKPRFGIFLLGNVNLNRYFPEIIARFWCVKDQVRAVTLPNGGTCENWNHQVLGLNMGTDRMYWICNQHELTSEAVICEIVTSNPYNRYINVTEKFGCCFSGYLVSAAKKS